MSDGAESSGKADPVLGRCVCQRVYVGFALRLLSGVFALGALWLLMAVGLCLLLDEEKQQRQVLPWGGVGLVLGGISWLLFRGGDVQIHERGLLLAVGGWPLWRWPFAQFARAEVHYWSWLGWALIVLHQPQRRPVRLLVELAPEIRFRRPLRDVQLEAVWEQCGR